MESWSALGILELTVCDQGLEEWLDVLRPFVVDGSPQTVERRALGNLRDIDAARRLAGLETGGALKVRLTNAKGTRSKKMEFELSPVSASRGGWPRTQSHELDGSVGYLRLPEMDDTIGSLRASMTAFRETRYVAECLELTYGLVG